MSRRHNYGYNRAEQEHRRQVEEQIEWNEYVKSLRPQYYEGLKNEQRTALARMIKPRGPRGVSLKEEIEGAAGAGSPAEFSRYAAYLSRQRGIPLTEHNVALEYAQQRGVFNENKYPSAVATGPVPSGRATRKLMRRIPWLVKELPKKYDESPTVLTGSATNLYRDPHLRQEYMNLPATVPKSKAQRNAYNAAITAIFSGATAPAPGGSARKRTRRQRKTRRSRR